MKILITDFDYCGEHYNEYELDMPNVKTFEQIPEGRLEAHIRESLTKLTK